MQNITEKLFELRDESYADFQARLIPGLSRDSIIGVRTPALRAFAKQLIKEGGYESFLSSLPHRYYDENQLHGFIISAIKDFDTCISEVERFLPYIDNWATCDQTSPAIFKKHKAELLPFISAWLSSGDTYTVRFAVGMFMQHFLDESFDTAYCDAISGITSEEYYINMEIAWFFATALAKQWDSTIPYLENHSLSVWTHNKTIQKAIESYRISDEQKAYLRTLKIK